jgi:MoaA/NifB/PqqE/SkfB family radical SAM enzyme
MKEMNPALVEKFGKIASRAIQERTSGTGRPCLLLHIITNRCMCNCKSCLWKNNDWEDVPLEDLKRFYQEAAEEGFLGTAISGGEPFLRKDLPELVRFVKEEAGIPILLFNTGWFLEERMDEVLPYVDLLLLSLDSASPGRYDEIRGLPGLFDRLMKGVDLVSRNYPELPIHFNACVQKGIADEIDDLIKLTSEKGLKISFDVITEYRHGEGDTRFSETDMGLPLSELRGVCAYLVEKKREGAPIINSEIYFKYFMDGKPGYKCHFPKLIMQLDGRGNVEECLNLDKPIANIRETPLKEIMELPRFKQLRVDAEDCCSCNSPTMVDLSNVWENPKLVFEQGGISVG